MQSLELNRAYYRDCIAAVLEVHCPHIARRHAAALIGWGSESLFEKYQAASRLSINRVIATYTNVSLVLGNSS